MSTFGGRDLTIFWSVTFAWRVAVWLTAPILILREVRKSHPGDIIFRQDSGKALAKLFILFSVTSFFGTGMAWHFMSNGIPDSQCTTLLDKQVTAIAIGAVVGITMCVVGPLLIWKWPWTWILVLDIVIVTSILTANWGDWTTVTWQIAILVVFNIGAGIAYMKARRYAMVMWTAVSLGISVDFSGQLVTRIDLPIYRRLDAWWCSCASQCGFRMISVASLVFLFLVFNSLLQFIMDNQDKKWRQDARLDRFDRIARDAARDEAEIRAESRRARSEKISERIALEQMRKREEKRAKKLVKQDREPYTITSNGNGHIATGGRSKRKKKNKKYYTAPPGGGNDSGYSTLEGDGGSSSDSSDSELDP